MPVVEMRGNEAYSAFCVFHKLMFGLKMLPMYFGESSTDFFNRVDLMTEEEQEKMLKEAIYLVPLERQELLDIVRMAKDPNGIRYSEASIKNMHPKEIQAIILEVCKEIARSKPRAFTDEEKKN